MANEKYRGYPESYDEYAGDMVYGNVAYDLDSIPKSQKSTEPEKRKRVKTRTYGVVKQNRGIPIFAIVGFALFSVMMIFVLLARLQLTQITDEAAHLETRIQELSEAEARIKVDYESTFNLTEIEEYATKQLGMVRSSDNVNFFQTTSVDRAEILEKEEKSSNFLDGFKDFISSLLEYF